MARLPERIVCLSTETVEALYLLGAEDRIVGISGFTTHPPRARKEKPKVSGFSSAKVERILAVEPDLVLAFSDLQGDIARDLIKAGVAVYVFNHRSVEGILAMVETLGRLVGREAAALDRKRPATPSPPGSPNSVFVSTPNDVDTNTLQFLLNSASAYACPAVGQ